MRVVVLVLVAIVSLSAQSPAPTHGPYADKDGGTWVCHRGATVERAKRVQCGCKAPCDNDGMEDRACLTYCTSPKCQCHLDEACH